MKAGESARLDARPMVDKSHSRAPAPPDAHAGEAGPRRDALLIMPDEKLLALCRTDRLRGTGRGGQKRNVTESAVRLTYPPKNIQAGSDANRSQTQNRRLALRALRRQIALRWRQPVSEPEAWPYSRIPGLRDWRRPLWTAHILDLLEAHGWRVAESARVIGVSTARLIRELARDTELWQYVNRARTAHALPPLRTPH